jgi:hypothetical protein
MNLIQEMKEHHFHNNTSISTVHCTLFEDTSGALTLAKAPAMRPRPKHINNKYHHVRSHFAAGLIDIQAIRLEDQPADMLINPLTESTFVKHRQAIMGWGHVPPSRTRQAILGFSSRHLAMKAHSTGNPAFTHIQDTLGGGQVLPSCSSLSLPVSLR